MVHDPMFAPAESSGAAAPASVPGPTLDLQVMAGEPLSSSPTSSAQPSPAFPGTSSSSMMASPPTPSTGAGKLPIGLGSPPLASLALAHAPQAPASSSRLAAAALPPQAAQASSASAPMSPSASQTNTITTTTATTNSDATRTSHTSHPGGPGPGPHAVPSHVNQPGSHLSPHLPSQETQLHIAEARAALVASMSNLLDNSLQGRASLLHANAAALGKQERDVARATEGLRKENEKLAKVAKDAGRKIKELGNVQNWAEVLERDFLVLEETVRLVREGSSGSEGGSGSCSDSQCSGCRSWSGSVSVGAGDRDGDGDGDVDMEGMGPDAATTKVLLDEAVLQSLSEAMATDMDTGLFSAAKAPVPGATGVDKGKTPEVDVRMDIDIPESGGSDPSQTAVPSTSSDTTSETAVANKSQDPATAVG
ncbi:hypothetical protein F5Y15DRAFT_181492 [Xylariaceae sp. FL0016]|nr:hypothetical protein F5Y15DRAFT_181492 [Xylariaceae sp. FL0016]